MAVIDEPDETHGRLAGHVLSEETKARLPDLVRILEEELVPVWSGFFGGIVVDDVAAFSGRLQALGKEYDYVPLVVWGEQVQEQVDLFQVDVLPKTLEQFSRLIEEIKALIA